MNRRNSITSFSSIGNGPLSFKSGDVFPEEWTLVGVHKMEKREPFDTWSVDLQANILSCARRLNASLEEHPHPNANLTHGDLNYSRDIIESETDRVLYNVYFERQPINTNPALYHLGHDDEIRQYRGL